MSARDLHYSGLVEVGQRIQKRELSAVEVTQAQLDRIARVDGSLKSYAHLMASSALGQAHAAEKEIAQGKVRGPLHGVPIAIKDLCWTKDAPTAAGMKIHRNNRPSEDATVFSASCN
jgi:amidase